ncbi:MAG: ABC transporter permease [Gallionella sp.]|nr:ABC transporter permease [Gallionella sp.]
MSLPKTSLRHSFAIQTRVTGALIMREIITRYGRHNLGFLWLFLEPMIFTLGITTLWTIIKATHGTNLPITAFAVTGYSSILLWRNCSNRAVKAIEANLSLLYHRPVKVFDIFAARLILEIAGATTSLIVLTIFFTSMGWMSLPEDILTVIIGWLLLAWFSFALSLIVGAASERSEVVERVWHVFTYLMFPLSGAAFMVDWLPKVAQTVILWVPMVHGTEMIRHGYFGAAVHTHEDPAYLVLVNLVMLLLGLALIRETGRRVEPE